MSQLKGILNQHKKIVEYNQATLALIHNYFYVSALIKSCKLFIPFSTPTPLAFFSPHFPIFPFCTLSWALSFAFHIWTRRLLLAFQMFPTAHFVRFKWPNIFRSVGHFVPFNCRPQLLNEK